MAHRPVFIPSKIENVVREATVTFEWVPGLARSQVQKCIRSLHRAAASQHRVKALLEISSKSESPEGIALSAFNLRLEVKDRRYPLECVYQASKVFHEGGPYSDLLNVSPRDAKRDERLKTSGPLVGFVFEECVWPLVPRTAFYDWLYVRALLENPGLASHVRRSDAFTDIAFNPAKSLSCQARSAALFGILDAGNVAESAAATREVFLLHHEHAIPRAREGGTLF